MTNTNASEPIPPEESLLSGARSRFAQRAVSLRNRDGHGSLQTPIGILRAQQKAIPDGILVVDVEGKVLSYNRHFLEIWRIPAEAAANGDDNELLGFAAEAVADWDQFIELVNYLYNHPDESRTGDSILLKDGRILTRATVPVLSDGRITGRAWYFREATEQYRAEVLQTALFRIAQLSREAGDLDEFYAAVHGVIGKLMDATNFYIAEYDPARGVMCFPYFVDQFDAPEQLPPGRGLTAYVRRNGEPLLCRPADFAKL